MVVRADLVGFMVLPAIGASRPMRCGCMQGQRCVRFARAWQRLNVGDEGRRRRHRGPCGQGWWGHCRLRSGSGAVEGRRLRAAGPGAPPCAGIDLNARTRGRCTAGKLNDQLHRPASRERRVGIPTWQGWVYALLQEPHRPPGVNPGSGGGSRRGAPAPDMEILQPRNPRCRRCRHRLGGRDIATGPQTIPDQPRDHNKRGHTSAQTCRMNGVILGGHEDHCPTLLRAVH